MIFSKIFSFLLICFFLSSVYPPSALLQKEIIYFAYWLKIFDPAAKMPPWLLQNREQSLKTTLQRVRVTPEWNCFEGQAFEISKSQRTNQKSACGAAKPALHNAETDRDQCRDCLNWSLNSLHTQHSLVRAFMYTRIMCVRVCVCLCWLSSNLALIPLIFSPNSLVYLKSK